MERLSIQWTNFHEIRYWIFLEIPSRKIELLYNLTKITCTWYEDVSTFMIICGRILLEWAIFQTEVAEKTKTHFLCSDTFSRKSCRLWVNPLNAELIPICHLPALLRAHHIFHVSGLRVNVEKYEWAGQVTDDNIIRSWKDVTNVPDN